MHRAPRLLPHAVPVIQSNDSVHVLRAKSTQATLVQIPEAQIASTLPNNVLP